MLLETERLEISLLTKEDAPFILELLNSPGWLTYIGDRGVKDLKDAEQYLLNGPMKSYQDHGFGLYLLSINKNRTPIGLCGLLKRDNLDDPDIGYALLPGFSGYGYAFEAAKAIRDYAFKQLEYPKLLAFTTKNNDRSVKLLDKLGFQYKEVYRMPGDEEELALFELNKA